VAQLLKRRGIKQVRVLAGGLQAWLDSGFPVDTLRLKVLE
jgi:3-mercaptopyruvate sulfurtransferase SseA